MLREPMTQPELERFDEALEFLVGEVPPADVEVEDAERVLKLFRPLTGRTAEGIFAEATFRRVRDVRSAVTWMEAWRDSTEEARRELSAFRFSDAGVFKRHRGYLEWPLIEVRVENGTGYTISLIGFRASLLSSDQDEAMLVEEFDHLVLDGLQPGESQVWRIEPEQREWIKLIDPLPDLEFRLEAMRLVALGGRVLVATDWGAVEENTLAAVHNTLRVIRTTGTLALDLPPLANTLTDPRQPVVVATNDH